MVICNALLRAGVGAGISAALLAHGEDVIRELPDAPYVEAAFGRSGVSEADTVTMVHSAELSELHRIPGHSFEHLVNRSWWSAARALILRSHEAHVDFTAPVRQAVASMKHEADALLRWLDPQFANPPETPMAIQWAQNSSTVLLAARFAPKWGAIGANLAVFSSEHGRGHIDHQRTVQHVQDLLKVSIRSNHIQADITAEAGNTRKHYILSLPLYAEVLPVQSRWFVEFRRAQGSMQMSHGAEIPELHFTILKQEESPWLRLTANVLDMPNSSIGAWPDAPGMDSEQPPFGEDDSTDSLHGLRAGDQKKQLLGDLETMHTLHGHGSAHGKKKSLEQDETRRSSRGLRGSRR